MRDDREMNKKERTILEIRRAMSNECKNWFRVTMERKIFLENKIMPTLCIWNLVHKEGNTTYILWEPHEEPSPDRKGKLNDQAE